MKIFQTKITNTTAYLLLLFTIASVALLFYGQFSNLEFETLNTTIEVTPVVDNNNVVNKAVGNSDEMLVEEMPASEVIPTTPVIENDMMSEPLVEETPAVE